MDRSERIGLGVSIAAHAAVFAALVLSFAKTPPQEPPKAIPIDISLADKVGLESSAPVPSQEELAAKKSPVEAPVEPEAAPAPAPEPEPQPAPPQPQPAPQPKPQPPQPKPAPAEKPQPKPKPAPAEKPQPAKPAQPAKSAPPSKAAPAKPSNAPSQSAATGSTRRPVKPTGNLAGLDLGRSNNKTNSTALQNPGSKASPEEMASFVGVIKRQIQPCANRQVTPGPGAERIRVLVRLHFNPDGSLAGDLDFTGVQGTDSSNERYVERVKDLARAVFKGCTPIRGLPANLYAVPNGWKSLPFSYGLPR
ncbi:cell envelope biogenesis protein TolA [Sphingomonas azotifigens]|uniref:cell envelope biogenesis protein TolA n=1 Tax=Sphingomonas azotifigens TaxID=330920 RepID=UPI000A06F5BF|nr:cell envelope biogenesis protein TolA [Sphingomonas azotifigens]